MGDYEDKRRAERFREEIEHRRRSEADPTNRVAKRYSDEREREHQRSAREMERERDQRSARERAVTHAASSRQMEGGGGCFAQETEILTPQGPREIATLTRGDHVLGFDDTFGYTVRKVERRSDHGAVRIWEIGVSHLSRYISTTKSHLFLTDLGWKRSRHLQSGDLLRTPNGWAEVDSVCETDRFEPVHNLVVEKSLSYFADGVVVHCFSHFRHVRTWLHHLELQMRTKDIAASEPWATHADGLRRSDEPCHELATLIIRP